MTENCLGETTDRHSRPLPIRPGRYETEQERKAGQGGVLPPKVSQGGAFQVDRAHDFDEIAWRDGVGDALRPPGHGSDGGEQSAHELEHHDKGEHHENALQDGGRLVGDKHAQTGHDEAEQDGGQIDQGDISFRHQPVYQPADEHPHRDDQDAHQPVGNQLGQDELQSTYGRDIHGLDGARLFLADQIKRGQEAANDDEQYHHERRYHVVAEVERRVIQVYRAGRRQGLADALFLVPLRQGVGHGLGGILRTQHSFGGIHAVGLQVEFRLLAVGQIPQEVFRDGDDGVRFAFFYLPERFVVAEETAGHGQIVRGIHIHYYPSRQLRAVVVHHGHAHVLHVECRHQGNNQHHQDGHPYYQTGDDGIPFDQCNFFLEQYLQYPCIHKMII